MFTSSRSEFSCCFDNNERLISRGPLYQNKLVFFLAQENILLRLTIFTFLYTFSSSLIFLPINGRRSLQKFPIPNIDFPDPQCYQE